MATPADRPHTQLIGTLRERPLDPRLAWILGVSALIPIAAGVLWGAFGTTIVIPLLLISAGVAQGVMALAVHRSWSGRILVWIVGDEIQARRASDGEPVVTQPLAAYGAVDIVMGSGLRRGFDVVLVHIQPSHRVIMGGGPHWLARDARAAAKVAAEHLGLPLTDDAAGRESGNASP